MDLSIYEIIKGPKLTEKAYFLNQKFNKLVLNVHPQANKVLIQQALKKLFNVEAESLCIIVSKGKTRRVGKFTTAGKLRKKAIVTLKKGQTVDLAGLAAPGAGSEVRDGD